MIVKVQVGSTVRETTLEALLANPGMERDAQVAITAQIMGLFEGALSNEWAKASVQINEVCDAMGWGYTR